MSTFCIDCLYTCIWALIGSILGFFSFRFCHTMSPKVRVQQCLLSVGLGLMVAFPLTQYLREIHGLSSSLATMLGGIGAFGLPEFILKYYPKMTKALATKIIDKVSDEASDRIIDVTEHEHKHNSDYDDSHGNRRGNRREPQPESKPMPKATADDLDLDEFVKDMR